MVYSITDSLFYTFSPSYILAILVAPLEIYLIFYREHHSRHFIIYSARVLREGPLLAVGALIYSISYIVLGALTANLFLFVVLFVVNGASLLIYKKKAFIFSSFIYMLGLWAISFRIGVFPVGSLNLEIPEISNLSLLALASILIPYLSWRASDIPDKFEIENELRVFFDGFQDDIDFEVTNVLVIKQEGVLNFLRKYSGLESFTGYTHLSIEFDDHVSPYDMGIRNHVGPNTHITGIGNKQVNVLIESTDRFEVILALDEIVSDVEGIKHNYLTYGCRVGAFVYYQLENGPIRNLIRYKDLCAFNNLNYQPLYTQNRTKHPQGTATSEIHYSNTKIRIRTEWLAGLSPWHSDSIYGFNANGLVTNKLESVNQIDLNNFSDWMNHLYDVYSIEVEGISKNFEETGSESNLIVKDAFERYEIPIRNVRLGNIDAYVKEGVEYVPYCQWAQKNHRYYPLEARHVLHLQNNLFVIFETESHRIGARVEGDSLYIEFMEDSDDPYTPLGLIWKRDD